MMRHTFADVTKAAGVELSPVRYETLPDGLFLATANVLGILTDYIFDGKIGDPEATIIGRVELMHGGRNNHYIGDRLKGGMYVGKDSFIPMLRTALGA